MIEALFAFAVQATGAEEFCRRSACTPPAPVTLTVKEAGPEGIGKGGWYQGEDRVMIKSAFGSVRWKITYVHESVHHLQRLRGQLQGYNSSPCVRWKTEQQAYDVAEAYARSIGYTTESELNAHGNTGRDKYDCERMIERGMVREFRL